MIDLRSQIKERPDVAPDELGADTGAWRVVVYDNPLNTYEEVITILIIATGCDASEAYIEAWEIDHLGKSTVHRANQEECQRAADIIATIGIKVEVLSDF
ncbi:MAG: ATP-dependent Clp protease adaptor ClpS [Fimbriimonadaceae bacterium]|jgi:ATP-dependent Clp protease adaptor protein ClpS|nr:ATP-dependent Clp protease adaptor ClpS [Fimbriimonadaceae bacterium]